MDLLLLGAAAVVLIALTLWIVVWPVRVTETAAATVDQGAAEMMPQGDQFEDQYTSATADLSAGGVATTRFPGGDPSGGGSRSSPRPDVAPALSAYQSATEAWSSPSIAHEGALRAAEPMALANRPASKPPAPRTIGVGAAALLTLGGAIGGAWLYARWQQQRSKPANRLKRRVIR